MKAFLAALMFLTRIPLPSLTISDTEWKKSAVYFPLVGLVIGFLLTASSYLLEPLFSPQVCSFLVVLIWIWVTGGLHIDGWMDLADGLGSSRSREEMLEIMKDSRVGAMGVIAAIVLIFGKWVTVYELIRLDLSVILVLCPIYARLLLIVAIRFWPYRSEGGLGAGLRTYVTVAVVVTQCLLIAAVTYYITGIPGLMMYAGTIMVGLLFIRYIFSKLQMLTGDCYGAIVEWSECASLFIALAVWRIAG